MKTASVLLVLTVVVMTSMTSAYAAGHPRKLFFCNKIQHALEGVGIVFPDTYSSTKNADETITSHPTVASMMDKLQGVLDRTDLLELELTREKAARLELALKVKALTTQMECIKVKTGSEHTVTPPPTTTPTSTPPQPPTTSTTTPPTTTATSTPPPPPTTSAQPTPPPSQTELYRHMDEQHQKEFRQKSRFWIGLHTDETGVVIPPANTSHPRPVSGYNRITKASPFLDRVTGKYTCPVRGQYEYNVRGRQAGDGLVRWAVYGNTGWRRELGLTKRNQQWTPRNNMIVACDEGEQVWVEVVRVKGKAGVAYCRVSGILVG